LIPLINAWTGKEVGIRAAMGSRILVAGGGLFLIMEIFCGIFPAYLSSRGSIREILKQIESTQKNYK
jgi:hypothetical protein